MLLQGWVNGIVINESSVYGIGRFLSIKTDVLLNFSLITRDRIDLVSPRLFSH